AGGGVPAESRAGPGAAGAARRPHPPGRRRSRRPRGPADGVRCLEQCGAQASAAGQAGYGTSLKSSAATAVKPPSFSLVVLVVVIAMRRRDLATRERR